MRTLIATLPALLLLASCGSLRETAAVQDDVYDIPDRSLVASVAPVPEEQTKEEEYYDPGQASRYANGTYADRTYNDPYYYNYSRFGFGYGGYGPYSGMGLGMNYGMGWNSGFGNNTWYNSPTGWYDPYWGNSWQSGYGMYGGSPYGYYNPWNAGFGGYGWGMPYNGGWSPYYGGSNPYMGFNPYCGGGGYFIGGLSGSGSPVVVAHRPGMNGGSTFNTASAAPRSSRQVPGLMTPSARRDRNISLSPDRGTRTSPSASPARKDRPVMDRDAQPRERRERREFTPRTFGGDQGSSPSRDSGGRGGGGSSPSTSPRPRR